MSTNKFATMLHRNTNKITLVLVYAMLEWILIFLLLLNSLSSYLIIKFVDYFGLKRPCIWCTRIDHVIEPGSSKCSCRDLVCDAHAFEISKLGFCLNHRKLAESETMCVDCSSSCHPNFVNLSQTWKQPKGMIDDADDDNNKVLENGVESLRCSCCGVNFVNKFYLINDKPSLSVLDSTQKQSLITESGVEAEINEGHHHSDHGGDYFVLDHLEEEQNTVENKGSDMIVFEVDGASGGGGKGANEVSDSSVYVGGKETTCGEKYKLGLGVWKGQEAPISEESLTDPKDDLPCEEITHRVAFTSENTEQIPPKHLDFVIQGNDFLLIPVEFGDTFASESQNQYKYMAGDDGVSGDEDVIVDFDMNSGVESDTVIENWHTFRDIVSVSSGSESTKAFTGDEAELIPLMIGGKNLELIMEEENLEQKYQEVKFAETTDDKGINGNVETNMKTYGKLCSAVSRGATQMHGDEFEAEVSTQNQDILEDSSQQIQISSSITTTVNVQDDSENLYQLHKKVQFHGRREPKPEELLEGSVISDIECDELTVEKLKSALKAERKALSALYAELEEERSASAIAATQAMKMINRLQEEKAAMQMEALQYERMMEEHSEYDQEALQLLNELMIKREKEILELEKELEIYRNKVHKYEVREKIMSRREGIVRRKTCPSCSNARESDGLSIDLSRDTNEENGTYSCQEFSNQNTPEDAVIYLEESLSNFEEERVLILEQLKILEEKIAILNYEEEYFDGHVNGLANGKHHDGRKTMCTKPKRVLSLFDATDTEAENGSMSSELNFTYLQNSSDEKVQLEKKKLDVEVEVDHVYMRLLALDADREFLKHCISSSGKGNKGLDLIQEILQHLRDLRNVEQRIRSMGDIAVQELYLIMPK
ncbi:hypothetical protein Fmac_001724 [Flemingia macrophylla]|uniref:GTD-binding domain-containing protein n=1 Tax=Flemingia macrophylla TaxID=520843 RepID=A0ABD1NHW4_9FABA